MRAVLAGAVLVLPVDVAGGAAAVSPLDFAGDVVRGLDGEEAVVDVGDCVEVVCVTVAAVFGDDPHPASAPKSASAVAVAVAVAVAAIIPLRILIVCNISNSWSIAVKLVQKIAE